MNTFKNNLKIIILGTIFALTVSIVSAQSGFNSAPANPPSGNTPEPLNVGGGEQIKKGPLVINEYLATNPSAGSQDGLWVAGRTNLLGDVNVGLISSAKYNVNVTGDTTVGGNLTLTSGNMDIKGTIKIQGGCTGGTCLGKILQSDSNGLASWVTPPSLNIPACLAGGGSGTCPDPYPLIWCRVASGQSTCTVSCRVGDRISSGGTAVFNNEPGQCSTATGVNTGTLNCQAKIGATNCVCAAMCDG